MYLCLSILVLRKPQTCQNANWWKSFNKEGWSTCDSNNKFITGFWRNRRRKFRRFGRVKSFGKDGIYRLEEAKCCLSSKTYRGQSSKCQNANWWDTFDKWVSSASNQYISHFNWAMEVMKSCKAKNCVLYDHSLSEKH